MIQSRFTSLMWFYNHTHGNGNLFLYNIITGNVGERLNLRSTHKRISINSDSIQQYPPRRHYFERKKERQSEKKERSMQNRRSLGQSGVRSVDESTNRAVVVGNVNRSVSSVRSTKGRCDNRPNQRLGFLCILIILLVETARWLTLMPSHRETARKGLKALSVLMERKAGMSAAPAQIAPKLISDS